MKNGSILLFVILTLSYLASCTKSIKYKLKENITYISECDNPFNGNGIKLNGKAETKTASNDSFSLNIKNEYFVWTDKKGTEKHKIFNFENRISNGNTQYIFNTEHNIIRITTKQDREAVIEILCEINEDYYCFSYLCWVE